MDVREHAKPLDNDDAHKDNDANQHKYIPTSSEKYVTVKNPNSCLNTDKVSFTDLVTQ